MNFIKLGKNYHIGGGYYLICAMSTLIPLCLFSAIIGEEQSARFSRFIIILGSECLLIMSPIWLAGKRWRLMASFIVASICLFCLVNTLYYRYWQDLIPYHSIINVQSYNSFVFRSIPDLLRPIDCLYMVCAIVPFISYRWLKMRDIDRFPVKVGITVIVMTLMIFGSVRLLALNARVNHMQSNGKYEYDYSDAWNDMLYGQWSRPDSWRNSGLCFYFVGQLLTLGDSLTISLSDDEKKAVDEFISNPYGGSYAHAFTGNKSKNLILIIVESLNSNIIEREVNGQELTPVLNSLIKSDYVLSCTKVVSQIKDGCSSDGQMIYNTGLLPVKNGVAAMLFGTNAFKSLVTQIKVKSAKEIIAEQGSVWNHTVTSSSFGYDELIEKVTDKIEAEKGQRHGHDASIFMYALDEMPKLPKPFLLELTTLSMHSPYKDPNATIADFLVNQPDTPIQVANYYRMANYFDTQLGLFLDHLKRSGVYDESVIVIASDHNMRLSGDEESGKSPIVFIALNAGITKMIDYPVGQIDVFPTILDLMGVEDCSWRGLGISMFNSENRSAVDVNGVLHGKSTPEIDQRKKDAWDISDMIIRSNYFDVTQEQSVN